MAERQTALERIRPREAVLQNGALFAAHRRPRGKAAARFQREHGRLLAARDRISESSVWSRGALPSIPNTERPSPPGGFLPRRAGPVAAHQRNRRSHQILVNTYVDDGEEVLLLRPSYAMYRFYAEVAGAAIREIDYGGLNLDFRSKS